MNNKLQEIFLRANTALFAQNLCATAEIMTGVKFAIEANSLTKGFFHTKNGFITFMRFAGAIQGEFILTMSEETASRIANAMGYDHKRSAELPERMQNAELFAEILNVAVGGTLPELEKKHGKLTQSPAYWVFGSLTIPDITSGNVQIKSSFGEIECTLALNKAKVRKE